MKTGIKLATQDKPFFPVKLAEKMKAMREFGFDGYEIDGMHLLNSIDDVKAAIKVSGLPTPSICGDCGGFIGDFDEDRRKLCVSNVTKMLENGAPIGVTGVVLPAAWGMFTFRLPPMVAPRDHTGDREAIHKSLKALDKAAGDTGTKIFLEPLNRYQDHMVNTQNEAREIIKDGGYKNVLTTADTYHMNIEEDHIAWSIRKNKDQIGHVHIGDNHRFQAGTGHIDFVEVMRALMDNGYEGWVALEHRIQGDDEVQQYRQSVAFLRECARRASA